MRSAIVPSPLATSASRTLLAIMMWIRVENARAGVGVASVTASPRARTGRRRRRSMEDARHITRAPAAAPRRAGAREPDERRHNPRRAGVSSESSYMLRAVSPTTPARTPRARSATAAQQPQQREQQQRRGTAAAGGTFAAIVVGRQRAA